MSISNIRVPPDSTGKRAAQQATMELNYASGTVAFVKGDVVTGGTSGVVGTVIGVTGNTSTGKILLCLSFESPEVSTIGENLNVDGSPNAVSSNAGVVYYASSCVVVSAGNVSHGQKVDHNGAALITYSDGQPTLDATGSFRTSQQRILGEYRFNFGNTKWKYWYDNFGSGSGVYDSNASQLVLSVGTGSGHRARVVSNKHHPYQPGTGLCGLFSIELSDTGKAGNTREWGLASVRDGVFFELQGTTLNVVSRSSTTGSIVETRTPQALWNKDSVDGSGTSGYNLDVSKRNVYWIDYTWMGAGAVRFGVYGNQGERIVCHVQINANSGNFPYIRTPALPFVCSNFNTGTTGSTTEMRVTCVSVHADATTDYVYDRYADIENYGLKTVVTGTPMIAVRAKYTYYGEVNTISTYPEYVSIYLTGGPARVECYSGAVFLGGGETWSVSGASSLEADVTATSFTTYSGSRFFSRYIPEGTTTIDMSPYFQLADEGVIICSDGVNRAVCMLSLTKLNPSDNVSATCTLGYRELK